MIHDALQLFPNGRPTRGAVSDAQLQAVPAFWRDNALHALSMLQRFYDDVLADRLFTERAFARANGTNHTQIQRWLRAYNRLGFPGLFHAFCRPAPVQRSEVRGQKSEPLRPLCLPEALRARGEKKSATQQESKCPKSKLQTRPKN